MALFDIRFERIANFADGSYGIAFLDAAGAAYDWTGSTFRMAIGARRGTGDPAVTLTQEDGDIAAEAGGVLRFNFRPEKLQGLGTGGYVFDLIRTVGGRDTIFATGEIQIIGEAIR